MSGAQVEGQSGLPVDNPTESYWHKEPSQKLLGHRTTADLPSAADVVIVGSGITGASAAHTLKERKPELDVVMLEAREACWGATGRVSRFAFFFFFPLICASRFLSSRAFRHQAWNRGGAQRPRAQADGFGQNGGHCQPAMYAAPPHIASFELRNYAYIKSLVEDYSIPCDWHSTSGVHAYYSPALFAVAEDVVKRLAESYPDLAANVAVVKKGAAGPPAYLLAGERKELTLAGLRVPSAEGAIVQWNAASLWPYKLVAFMLERLLATENGNFNLQTNTPVTGLQRVEPPTNLSGPAAAAASHPAWIVQTPRGRIAAKHVLLATNGYTSYLLPQFADLIVPTRGQIAALRPPQEPRPGEPPLDIGHTFYIIGEDEDGAATTTTTSVGRDDYLVQRPPPAGELILGGGRQLARHRAVGVWDDGELDEPVRWWLRGELPAVMDLGLRAAPGEVEAEEHRGHHVVADADATGAGAGAPAPPKKQDLAATHEWTGIMGYSRDAHPWVGAVPAAAGGGDGLWLCAGYTGHGMPNAALCGRAAAAMLLGAINNNDDEEIDLPPEYELTEARLLAARRRDTVAVAEERDGLLFDLRSL